MERAITIEEMQEYVSLVVKDRYWLIPKDKASKDLISALEILYSANTGDYVSLTSDEVAVLSTESVLGPF